MERNVVKVGGGLDAANMVSEGKLQNHGLQVQSPCPIRTQRRRGAVLCLCGGLRTLDTENVRKTYFLVLGIKLKNSKKQESS